MSKGKLYLVATPIGNLEDITLRALRLLREAHLIACEDTRRTKQLCRHFDIETPLISYHEHNERSRAEQLIAKMQKGMDIALVSDAGTPAVSDPGTVVVQQALAAGIPVIPVPGPAAFVAALIASGMDTRAFVFAGFLPRRAKDRRERLEHFSCYPETLLFYVSPHRYKEVIRDMAEVLGGERRLTVARELTKVHETFVSGSLADPHILEYEPLGEICLVIEGGSGEKAPDNPLCLLSAEAHYRHHLEQGLSRKEALRKTAEERGVRRNELYDKLFKS